jgi:hypothetical protein
MATEGQRFDTFAKSLASVRSRRGALKAVVAGLLGFGSGAVTLSRVSAAQPLPAFEPCRRTQRHSHSA